MSETEKEGSEQRTGLPFSFEVNPSERSSRHSLPITVTLLQKIQHITVEKLPTGFSKQQTIVRVDSNTHDVIQSFSSAYFYAKIQRQLTDKDWQVGIVFHAIRDFYGVVVLQKDTRFKDINSQGTTGSQSCLSTRESNIASWKAEYSPFSAEDAETNQSISAFSMKPPTSFEKPKLSKSIDPLVSLHSPQAESDPMKFLFARYFTILYSLNTPLSYFPKTSLARLKNLCSNDPYKIRSVLQKVYLSASELDVRHGGKYGILKLLENTNIDPATTKERYENESQNDFLKRHGDLVTASKSSSDTEDRSESNSSNKDSAQSSTADERLGTLVLELKVREAQIQILILLELILLSSTPEAVFLDESVKLQEKEFHRTKKQTKQSLVRKKKSKAPKKIIPTFLGMGISAEEESSIIRTPVLTDIDDFSLFTTLTTLVDRMGIWDTLLGRGASKKDDSAFGFVAYVLIPYFNRKLPLTIKFIIDKFKASNPKLVPPKADKRSKVKRTTEAKETATNTILSGPDDSKKSSVGSNPSSSNKHPSKFPKKSLDPDKVPYLHRSASASRNNSTNGSLNDDPLSSFSLRRSKSTLSAKNLERRQVDISMITKPTNEPSNPQQLSKRTKSVNEVGRSAIFGDARRLKSTSLTSSLKPPEFASISQVQATPAKTSSKESYNNKNIHVMATPSKTVSTDNRERAPPTFISQTPMLNRASTTIIPASADKGPSVTNRLFNESLQPPIYEQHVNSSPVYDNSGIISSPVMNTINSYGRNFDGSESSPTKSVITSSPVVNGSSEIRRLKRPGEPVSVTESPFFNTTLNGSPFASKGKSLATELRAATSESIFGKASIRKRRLAEIKSSATKLQKITSQNPKNDTQDTDDDEDPQSAPSTTRVEASPNIKDTSNDNGPNIKDASNQNGPNIKDTSNQNGPNIKDTSNDNGPTDPGSDSDSDLEILSLTQNSKPLKTYSRSQSARRFVY